MRRLLWLVAVPVGIAVLAVGGTFVYLNFVREDAPARLSFADLDEAGPADDAGTGATDGLDGAWTVAAGSQVGYRVDEILFGQRVEAVGRTGAVTGTMEVAGATVTAAGFEVDLRTVTSDQSRRDDQFQGRIMDTARHPTATFELTEPIVLGAVPADGEEVSVEATGDLTLRGTTRPVTFTLLARRNGGAVEVNGTIPIAFGDYGIPNPSFGPASVGDEGELEVLLVLRPAG